MRRIGHDDLVPGGVAAGVVVGPDEQDAGELAMGAGGGLERGGVHAADLREHPLELPQELQRALGERIRRERVELREARQARRPLVHPRVVLHGAGTQGIEAAVHGIVQVGQVGEVADDLGFGQLRQPGRDAGERIGGRVGHLVTVPAGHGHLRERGLE